MKNNSVFFKETFQIYINIFLFVQYHLRKDESYIGYLLKDCSRYNFTEIYFVCITTYMYHNIIIICSYTGYYISCLFDIIIYSSTCFILIKFR